jgi:TPR repeat protein
VNVVSQQAPKTSKHFERLLSKAKSGDRAAQFEVGVSYETGAGVGHDCAQAVKWYQESANQGDLAAQNNLGGLYLRGFGVAQDDAFAFAWYLRAGADGFLPAQDNIGIMYAAGRGPRANYEEAVPWYRRAAESGERVRSRAIEPRVDARGWTWGFPRSE